MATLTGLSRLDRKLKRLPELAKVEIKAAMEVAAADIVATMKQLVPVSKPNGGDLRDSIGWTWGKAPKGAGLVAAVKSRLAGDLTITIYAGNEKAFYARWVEFGTQAHSTAQGASVARGKKQDQGTQHKGTPAQPFFFVSYRAHRKSAKRRINAAIRKAAKKVAAS